MILRETDFQLLLLSTMLPVLGSAMLSPVLDSLIDPFGTSTANIGLLISFFTAPGIVMIPIAGVLADRYSRKPILVTGILLFGMAGVALAFTTDFRVALGLRVLQGVGFGGINPIIITVIGDIYTGEREATGQGLRFMVGNLSAMVFPVVGGVLVVIAWQYPFLLYGLAIPVAMVVYLWFEEPTPHDGPTATDGDDGRAYQQALLRLVRRRRVLSVVIARALPLVVWVGFATYNSIIVVRLMDGTPPQAGLLFAVLSAFSAIVASQAGRLTSLFDSRFYLLVGGNGCLGVGFVVPLFAPGLGVAAVGVAILGAGMGITLSLYRSIITDLAPESLRAGLVSLAEAGGRLAATVTPVVMGGVIAVATPVVGFVPALQLTGLGVALVGGGGGLVCLFIASVSPPVSTASTSR